MAVAEIIGAAIGVLLLVVVAYLLVGGTLTAAETVANAQKDLTLLNEARLRTDWHLNDSEIEIAGNVLNFSITNTGNEVISDFPYIDVYTDDSGSSAFKQYTYEKTYSGTSGYWTLMIENDRVHPNQLDPGEKAWILATFSGSDPVWVQMTTRNGVYAQLSTGTSWRV